MHLIKYNVDICEVNKYIEKNYFMFRDLFYRVMIVCVRDLVNDERFSNLMDKVIIEENNYHGLMNMFISNNEDIRSFLSNKVSNLDTSLVVVNFYENVKLTLEKSLKSNKINLLSLNIKNSSCVELFVKYL